MLLSILSSMESDWVLESNKNEIAFLYSSVGQFRMLVHFSDVVVFFAPFICVLLYFHLVGDISVQYNIYIPFGQKCRKKSSLTMLCVCVCLIVLAENMCIFTK